MTTRWAMCMGLILALSSGCLAQVMVSESPADATRLSTRGVGKVDVMPDAAVMLCGVSGDAELTQDAVIKFKDAKRRAVEALQGLGLDNLKIEPMGMSLGTEYDQQTINMMRNGMMGGGDAPKPRIIASESLRLTLEHISDLEPEALTEMMANLVEVVQDNGLALGSPDAQQMRYQYGQTGSQLFVFQVTDTSGALAEARRLAVKDARSRAEALAEDTGVKLGRVIMVSENEMNSARQYGGQQWQMYQQLAQAVGRLGESSTVLNSSFSEIPVQMQVSMSFRIVPEKPDEGQP